MMTDSETVKEFRMQFRISQLTGSDSILHTNYHKAINLAYNETANLSCYPRAEDNKLTGQYGVSNLLI